MVLPYGIGNAISFAVLRAVIALGLLSIAAFAEQETEGDLRASIVTGAAAVVAIALLIVRRRRHRR